MAGQGPAAGEVGTIGDIPAEPERGPIRIGRGERVLFVGTPRSGKSNLIMAMLVHQSSFVVVDSKRHNEEWVLWAPLVGAVVTSDPAEIERHARVIYQPRERQFRDRQGWTRPDTEGWQWTLALEALQRRGRRTPTIAVFDEVIQSMPAGSCHPIAAEILTQGAGFGISVWGGTQIPNRMETLLPRLAEHCFSFAMHNLADRRILAATRGCACEELALLPGPPRSYDYGYHRVGARSWRLLGAVDDVLAAHKGRLHSVPANSETEAEPAT